MVLGLGNLFKKKKKDELKEMTPSEKESFLNSDMANRMIRVEQRVAASFGDHIPYNQTDYYKSLPKNDKMKLNRLIAKKGKKKFGLFSFLLASVLALGALRFSFTGNAIADYTGADINISTYVVLGIMAVLFFVLCTGAISENGKRKRDEKHIRVLEEVISGKKVS